MDYLEISGVVQDTWWWWIENEMSVALTDVVLTRPEGAEEIDLGDDDDETDDETDEETEAHGDDDVDGDDAPYLGGDLPATGNFGDDPPAPMACNSATAAGSPMAALWTGMLLAGALLRRRIA